MESNDLQLLEEMDDDDDFLIPDLNQTTPFSKSKSHFTCSPFAIPSSLTINNLQETRNDILQPTASSSEANTNNKENINSKNVEVPKLGVKPLQMKTRKKGYNLRTSLAWDKAFFTDEGILDPSELTLVTGINPNTYVGGLSTISEQGNTEQVPLRESNDKRRTTLKENRDKPSSSAGNHDSLPHHKVTNKALSISHINRSGSKVGGCLKPLVASSSLKRPANLNTLKTATKEAKLPKLPISKRQSCFSATTKSSLPPSQLRNNMIPKPTTNVQKNVGLKSSVKNVHDSQSEVKKGPGSLRLPAKELAKKSVRKLTNSSSKVASSTKVQMVQLDKASTGSEIVPDRLQHCEFREESAPISAKNLSQNTVKKSNKLLTEAGRLNSSGPGHMQRASNELMISDRMHACESQDCPAAPQHINLHNNLINQPARPSGLRMPSPSLRFFDQRTDLESGSLLQKKTCSNRKVGEVRPPAEPRRTPMKSNDVTEREPSTLSTPCASTLLSPLPNYMENIIDTKGKFVLQNEVNGPQNHTATPVSTSGQSIQHQKQIFSTVVDDSLKFNHDSHLDADRLDAEVFLESQKNVLVKREPEVGLGPENYSNLTQLENLGQANNPPSVIDRKRLCLEDDARCNTDSTCSGKGDAIELKGIVTMMKASCIPFQNRNIGKSNDDAVDVVTEVLNDDSSAEKCFEACVSEMVNSQFHSEGQSVNCIMPAESPNLEKGPCASATAIKDDIFQEKSVLNYTSDILLDVSEKKQDGVDVAPDQPFQEVQLEFREVSPSTDDHNQSNLSRLRPAVELLGMTASVGDDAFLETESLLQVAQCASTYPESLEKERQDLVAATIESEVKINEDTQKSQEMGINILSFSDKSILDEKSQNSRGNLLEANPTVEGCTRESISYIRLQSENQTLQGFGTVSNFSKKHVEDAQVQLLKYDIFDDSCHRLTSELHNHAIQNVDHNYICRNQPEVSNTDIELKVVSESNHPLLANRDNIQQLFVDRSDIYTCDPKSSNAPRGEFFFCLYHNNNGQLCGEYGTSGSRVIDSTANHNEKHVDTYNTECTYLAVPSKLDSSDVDEMVGVKTTCMEYYSSSFQREVADSMLDEKRSMFGALFDIGQILEDNDRMVIKNNQSPEKIANLDEPNDALYQSPEKIANLDEPGDALYSIIAVPVQGISLASDLQNSNADAQSLQGNVSVLDVDDQPNKPQDCFGIIPSMETYNEVKNGMELCGQHPSECNSSFPVSHQPTAGEEPTSTTLCSVTAELCQVGGKEGSLLTNTYGIEADGSNIRFGQQVETKVAEVGKSPMVDELHHELDHGGNLKENKEETVLIKRSNNIRRQDNSLVIHPPNVVPFSDEWLAAIEAAGEEILTMKCGAVQHSPPDKSLPEPSPWSPVRKKANQIGPYDCTKYTNALPSNPDSSN